MKWSITLSTPNEYVRHDLTRGELFAAINEEFHDPPLTSVESVQILEWHDHDVEEETDATVGA